MVADAWRDEKAFCEALEDAKKDWTDEMSIESQIKKLFTDEDDKGQKLDANDKANWIKATDLDSHICKHVKNISKKKIREMMILWGYKPTKISVYFYKGIRKIDPECMFDDDY